MLKFKGFTFLNFWKFLAVEKMEKRKASKANKGCCASKGCTIFFVDYRKHLFIHHLSKNFVWMMALAKQVYYYIFILIFYFIYIIILFTYYIIINYILILIFLINYKLIKNILIYIYILPLREWYKTGIFVSAMGRRSVLNRS